MNFREIRIKTPPKGENSKTYCPTRSTYKKPYKSKKNNVIKIYNGHNTQIVEFIKTKTYSK